MQAMASARSAAEAPVPTTRAMSWSSIDPMMRSTSAGVRLATSTPIALSYKIPICRLAGEFALTQIMMLHRTDRRLAGLHRPRQERANHISLLKEDVT